MDQRHYTLAQAMALLMSTTPDTTLGKLLNFCLATKVDAVASGKTALEFAEYLLDHPSNLVAWMEEVSESDGTISTDEWIAIEEMHLTNPDAFMAKLEDEFQGLTIETHP